ncbi:MAG: LUD domain-containing protein [Deferrisomatales bacterium]
MRHTADLLAGKRAAAAAACPGFEALRDWGRARKTEVSTHLAQYADAFARRAEEAGARVYRARDGAHARAIAAEVARGLGAAAAVKSKSMTAEEVELNEALEAAGCRVTETDLGEFIVQLAGERPSHILAPAIHRDRRQVAELFSEHLGTAPDLDVGGLVRAARAALRERFLAADLGVTGANFAVAETGTLVLVTNEGNGRLATTLPRAQLAVVGVDKIIPTLADLPGFLELLTRSASGQPISSYVTLVTGPRRPGEEEGPGELHIVLLDHGRSAIAGGEYRQMLHCLHCGACLNHCPVYRAVGGHAYGSAYCGPMGGVLSPLLWGAEAHPELPHACTLCGRCAEACPVRIPLADFHRRLRGAAGPAPLASRAAAVAAARPFYYRIGLALARRWLRRGAARGPLAEWTRGGRDLPRPEPGPTFRQWWARRAGEAPGRVPVPGPAADPRPPAPNPPGPAPTPAAPPAPAYADRARAAGVAVEEVPLGELPGRLAALVREEGVETAALPARGWPGDLRERVAEALARAGCGTVGPVQGEDGYAWDRGLLASARLGITWCGAFAAATGSQAYPSGPGHGTLASLLPEVHLALSTPAGEVATLADLLPDPAASLPSRGTLVTGPSRTGDIEATMTVGVHGPRRVLHWLLTDPTGAPGAEPGPAPSTPAHTGGTP